MDYLREGIYLRAYSQRDPLVEYQREGFDMFAAMMDGIKEESVGFLFNLQVEVREEEQAPAPQISVATPQIDFAQAAAHAPVAEGEPQQAQGPTIRAKGLDRPKRPQNLSYSAPSEDGEAEVVAAAPARTTSSPASAATRLCPAARARSSSGATAPPAVPPPARDDGRLTASGLSHHTARRTASGPARARSVRRPPGSDVRSARGRSPRRRRRG